MRLKRVFAVLLGILSFSIVHPALAAEKYAIDPSHATVEFSVKHMMLSNVKGSFSGVAGNILYDESDITKSSVSATIPASTINTNNAKRDEHLKSADFLDAEKFPQMTFQSTNIQKKGDSYVCIGDLTLHGVTKRVEIPFTISGKITDPGKKVRIAAEGEFTIKRKDFGINWNKTMDNGGLVVGEDVKVYLSFEAIQQG